ncbi:MAG: DEAD/DEAH box helicase, partial [Chloroflexota bacterium]
MGYAEVAVNASIPGRETFSYAVPQKLSVSPGQAVLVPFGERLLQGIIIELAEVPSFPETRELKEIVDPKPLLSPEQIKLARWLSDYYLSPLFDALSLMLPPGFERKNLTFIAPTEKGKSYDSSSLNDIARQLLVVVEDRGEVRLSELEKQFGKNLAQDTVSYLTRLDLLKRSYRLGPVKVKPKYETWLAVSPGVGEEALSTLKGAPKQAILLDYLLKHGETSLKAVSEVLGVNRTIANALVAKGLIVFEQIQVRREPIDFGKLMITPPPTLTPTQTLAFDAVRASLVERKPDVFLLHGVTGAGKTEVYLQALAEAVRGGRKGIVLVPEIALTSQTIERFAARFPRRVAVLHSRLSLGQRFDEWQRIRDGEFDVVIGPRSALFAPQPNLGLIVIDEEHDPAYKQKDVLPFYHAREVALKLSELTHSVVILGSATP